MPLVFVSDFTERGISGDHNLMGYGERLGECQRKADMVTSELEKIDKAAVARSEEIRDLSSFLTPYKQPRSFCKDLPLVASEVRPGALSAQVDEDSDLVQRPFHHLREELALLLGVSGSNLVLSTWERHGLDLQETNPERLRPALLKLFSTAARIAAPRGNSLGLKAVIRAFESDYFPITPATPGNSLDTHRFSLLALIQTGRGASLLSNALSKSNGTAAPVASDSQRVRLRREFLFESSVRAKSWTEAYRHSRVLTYGSPRPKMSLSVERRLAEVYRNNLGSRIPGSKKKQLLADIARLPAEYDEQPEEFALRAVSALAVSCRPGEDDALLCRLLPASDPRWRVSMRRLYRHRPQANSWMTTLRKLWQQEPTLRPYCRLLFSLLRFSRRRAEVAFASLPVVESSERLELCQLKSRMARAREEVQAWEDVVGRGEGKTEPPGGTFVNVRRTLWEHIVKVAHELGLPAPRRVRVVPRFDDIGMRTLNGETELVVSPVMLSTREGEARFLVARAMYRHAVGLDALESAGRELVHLPAIAARAVAHAESHGYSLEPFSVWQNGETSVELDELQVALEEMYWSTGDAVFARLCELLANRCWCPRAELEADLYAHRFCDAIDATYGVLSTGLACLPLYRDCESTGIAAMLPRLKDYPNVVLRLQNLWMSGTEEVQKSLTRCSF